MPARYYVSLAQTTGNASVIDREARIGFSCVALFRREDFGSETLYKAQAYAARLNTYNAAKRI